MVVIFFYIICQQHNIYQDHNQQYSHKSILDVKSVEIGWNK